MNIRGDYDKGKIFVFSLLTWNSSSISQFVYPVEGDGVTGMEGRDCYFSPLQVSLFLENMKIWCKIQVIIYLFFRMALNLGFKGRRQWLIN